MGIGFVYFLGGSFHRYKVIGGSTTLLLSIALFFTLLVPKIPFFLYGHPDGKTNSNTGSVLLGLTRGTNWSEAEDFVLEQYGPLPEKEAQLLMVDLAFGQLINNPSNLLKSLAIGGARAVYVAQQKIGISLGFRETITGLGPSISAKQFMNHIITHPTIWATSLFFLVSVLLHITLIRKSLISKVFTMSLLVFSIFAPIVFTDGGWRVTATLYPGLSLLILGIPLYF